MVIRYLLLLALGHVLGDFYFQSEKMAQEKDKKYKGVVWHSIEYLFSVWFVLLPVISKDMAWAGVLLAVTHFVVDTTKYILINKFGINKTGRMFVADQVSHIICIFIVVYMMYCWHFQMTRFSVIHDVCEIFSVDSVRTIKWILALLVIHIPANILIQNLTSMYKPKEDNEELIKSDNKVGRKIGTVERLIMLMFIAMDQYAAMGLVLTAKSIARYDKITKDEKFAEYYLLGTLLSTACVVFCKIIILN